MTNHEPERFKSASAEQMTLTRDNRMVYVPGVNNRKLPDAVAPAIFLVLFAAAALSFFLYASRTPPTLSTAAASAAVAEKVENASPALQLPFPAITEPSPEWMLAHKAVLDEVSKPDSALLASLLQVLGRLQIARHQLTAPQRKKLVGHNQKGLAAVKANQFTAAAQEFFAAFQIDSSDPEITENLGYALYKDGKNESATRALLQALVAAPQRASAWGNLGGAYALAGERVHATAAFSLSLRFAKQPRQARSSLIKTYQGDPSEVVRAAAAEALSNNYASLVEPGLREHLGNLSKFPFSVLLPSKIAVSDLAGVRGSVYVLNNAEFPIKADSTEYAVWFGSGESCQTQACIVGQISGGKSREQSTGEGAVVDLAGGVKGVIHQGAEKQQAWLTIERNGISHRFFSGSESEVTAMANSALNLGSIPASVFANRPVSSKATAVVMPLDSARQVTPLEKPSTTLSMLTISPKGAQLSSEQIYEKASGSVVVVRVSDAQGSGIVVAPEIVVTNCHVTKQGDATVEFRKVRYRAVGIAGSVAMDYCILKVAGLPAISAQIGPLTEVAPGQRVYSLGSPRGLELTFAEGLVSALRQDVSAPLSLIQTTAPISPGSSGGGLFDAFGRVIGITTLSRVESQNLNFALPIELYKYIRQTPFPQPYQAPATQVPAYSPAPASDCNISFKIELQTFGENVNVELRTGQPGSSMPISSRRSQGGRVGFSNLCPGNYFLAIGNDDYVSVTPVRNFVYGGSYTSQITLQRGSGNVSKQSKKSL